MPAYLWISYAHGVTQALRHCRAELVAMVIFFSERILDNWWHLTRGERYWHSGIFISGSVEFIAATVNALEVLKNSSHFEEIRRNIHVIKEGRRSGIIVGYRTTCFVGRPSWNTHPIWYAGCLAHAAYRNILHFNPEKKWWFFPITGVSTGRKARKRCTEYQLKILKDLEAPGFVLEYLIACMENTTHQEKPWGYVDYLKRNW